MDHRVTHQPLQDPLALVVGAVVRQDAPVDQNQAVQEQPGAEPQQSEHQRPPAWPQPETQPPQQAQATATATPPTWPQSSRKHDGCADHTQVSSDRKWWRLLRSAKSLMQK